jgi:hypothetical protein
MLYFTTRLLYCPAISDGVDLEKSDFSGTAEQAAEKCNKTRKKLPSGAEAR